MATIRQTLLRHAPKILWSVALLYVLAAVAYWITLYLQHRIAGDEFFVERLEFWGQGVLLILFYVDYVLVPFAVSLALRRWLFAEKALLVGIIEGLFWYVMVALSYLYSNEQCPMAYLIPILRVLGCYVFQFPLLAILHRLFSKGVAIARPEWWRVLVWGLLLMPGLILSLLLLA
ncbi:MAG: hypothetical protein IKT85_01845 [Kiritimatiellae bacterium]|nr:hypothetical protein [Kiritimatiellia bacterium]